MEFSLKEFEPFVSEVNTHLKKNKYIILFGVSILSNESEIKKLIEKAVGDDANVYVIWSRKSKGDEWTAKYIGQRKKEHIKGRLREHLWSKSDSTKSKLKKVHSEWDKIMRLV